MKTKAKSVFGPLAALGVAAAFIWPGCAPLPIGSQRVAYANRKPQDFEFAKSSKSVRPMTRDDLINNVGHPDVYFPDIHVACYKVDSVIRRRLWLFLFVLPISEDHVPDGIDVAYVQFDEHDNVVRAELVRETTIVFRDNFETSAKRWLATKDKSKR